MQEETLFLNVKVTPKSAKNRVGDVGPDGFLRVYVTVVPEKGKANKAVIALLSKTWGLSKQSFEIVKGDTSSVKTIRIKGPAEILKMIQEKHPT